MKYVEKFLGSFVYYIKHKASQQIVYIGETGNFVQRYVAHFDNCKNERNNSKFHNWCLANGYDKQDFEFVVLDLSNYDIIDADDRRIIERVLRVYHGTSIINPLKRPLNSYEKDRFEYLSSIIDFYFAPYTELKQTYIEKQKDLSIWR